jgi:pectate lyase
MQLFERCDDGHAAYALFYRIMRLIVCRCRAEIAPKLPHVGLRRVIVLMFQLTCAIWLSAADVFGFEGFGSGTPGGNNGTVVAVTNLKDSGSGSLRSAIAGNNRRIIFKVSGTINLLSALSIRDRNNITIDGTTAPGSGITLKNRGITIRNSRDVIVTNLRIRDSKGDGITLWDGSRNVVLDHLSVTNSFDGNIDITEDTRNVTVSWCILGDTRPDWFQRQTKGMLIANFNDAEVSDVSVHHNLFINQYQRSPQVDTPGLVDIRNNVMRSWGARAIRIRGGGFGNIVNNVFDQEGSNLEDAVVLDGDADPVHISGNLGPGSRNVNSQSTAAAPYNVAPVTTHAASQVEEEVFSGVGAFPRDSIDASLAGSE